MGEKLMLVTVVQAPYSIEMTYGMKHLLCPIQIYARRSIGYGTYSMGEGQCLGWSFHCSTDSINSLSGAFEVPNLDVWKSVEAHRLLDECTCVVERKNEVSEKRYRTRLRWLMG